MPLDAHFSGAGIDAYWLGMIPVTMEAVQLDQECSVSFSQRVTQQNYYKTNSTLQVYRVSMVSALEVLVFRRKTKHNRANMVDICAASDGR